MSTKIVKKVRSSVCRREHFRKRYTRWFSRYSMHSNRLVCNRPRILEFMEAALDKVEQNGNGSVQLSKVRQHVKSSYNMHDKAFKGAKASGFTKSLQTVKARSERTRRREALSSNHESETYDELLNLKPRYQNLCKGTYRQVERDTSKLFCSYEHQVDPNFKIGPLKLEFVAPQTKLECLKMESHTRIPHIGSVRPVHCTHINRLQQRLITDLAGRSTGLQYNEEFHKLFMSVYTPGAYFMCHIDLDDKDLISTFSIAVFMVYVSRETFIVKESGGTGFCKRGFVVQPEAGSAILWYDMLTSGKSDVMSDHCSCPVVYGGKWGIVTSVQDHESCGGRSYKADLSFRFSGNSIDPYGTADSSSMRCR